MKKVLIVLGAIVALFFIIPIFTAKDYHVVREVTINKPKTEVFSYLKMLKNQDNFSVWAQMDPNMKKNYTGTDGTVGFVSAWESDNKDVGKGEQEIMGITEGQRIDYELRFKEPFESKGGAYMTTADAGGATKVEWGFEGNMAYPMNIMMLFMDMEKALGPSLAEGLDNLKKELEG